MDSMNERSMRQAASLSKMAAVAATALALSVGAARADTLQATDDAYIVIGNKSASNFGGNANLLVQNSREENQTLLRFDFSVLTDTAVIEKASLRLWVDSVGQAGIVDLYVVFDPWAEGTVTGDLMPAADAVPFASLPIALSDAGNFVTIDITDQFLDWRETLVANNGILLVPNTGGVDVTFNSKENPQTAHQPELEIIAAPQAVVPSGAVLTFDQSACPTGWSEYLPARGRYLVGGSTPGIQVGTMLAIGENRAVGTHSHAVDPPVAATSEAGLHKHSYADYYRVASWEKIINSTDGYRGAYGGIRFNESYTDNAGLHSHTLDIPAFSSGMTGSVAGTNAPYLPVLMCRKD